MGIFSKDEKPVVETTGLKFKYFAPPTDSTAAKPKAAKKKAVKKTTKKKK